MLQFKAPHADLVRRGAKTQTIRIWKRLIVRPGEVHRITGGGRVKIESVEVVTLDDLTEADAQVEGCSSLTALVQAIGEIYGAALDAGDRTTYRIRFTYLGPEPTTRGLFDEKE